MKLRPYVELLKMSKEKVNDLLAPVRAAKARKQAELEVAKLEELKVTVEEEVNAACTKQDINFHEIIEKLDKLAMAERKKRQFEKLISELFPGR